MASDSDHSASEGAVNDGPPPASPVNSSQGSSAPDPVAHPTFKPLQRVKGLVQGIAISVGVGDGRYYDVLPLVEAGLREVRHAGGTSLAHRYEQELHRVKGWMYHLEELAYDDPSDVPPPLSLCLLLEREERAKRIRAKEAELKRLRKQHEAMLVKMDAYHDAVFFKDAESSRGEARLRRLELENRQVCSAAREAEHSLQLLRQEEKKAKLPLPRCDKRRRRRRRPDVRRNSRRSKPSSPRSAC